MTHTDKHSELMDRLKVIIQGLSIDNLKLVLRFAEFLAEEQAVK